MEITEGLYVHVEKVAKSTAYKWTDLDWEDIRQDMWVHFLERPNEMDRILEDDYETRDKKLRKVGSQVAVAEVHGYEQYSGQYIYGTDEVRGLLRAGVVLKSDAGTSTERTDLSLAMLELKDTNPSYFEVIVDNYVHEKILSNTERVRLTRARDKLTLLMNKIHNLREWTYHSGPGARQVHSNGRAIWITRSATDEDNVKWVPNPTKGVS